MWLGRNAGTDESRDLILPLYSAIYDKKNTPPKMPLFGTWIATCVYDPNTSEMRKGESLEVELLIKLNKPREVSGARRAKLPS